MSRILIAEDRIDAEHQHNAHNGNSQKRNNQPHSNGENEEYMVCFSRRSSGCGFAEDAGRANYEIVMTADGDFAARRLDTGFILAGYSDSQPDLPIEDAARNVFALDDVYKIYVLGDFSTVMSRIINEYYDRLRDKYNIWSRRAATIRFPLGRIRPDPLDPRYPRAKCRA